MTVNEKNYKKINAHSRYLSIRAKRKKLIKLIGSYGGIDGVFDNIFVDELLAVIINETVSLKEDLKKFYRGIVD